MEAGHLLIGAAGELVSMDANFLNIMHATDATMRGRLVIDVTAPADREECATAIRNLRDTGRGFEITKRLIRDDGSLIWVKNTVSITIGADNPGLIMATVAPAPQRERGPAVMLDKARSHVRLLRSRETVCDPKFFFEPGWNAILALYVAEAEGRSLDVFGLARNVGISAHLADRWICALLADGVVEVEYANLQAHTAKSYRLTAQTITRLESFLTHVSR